MKRIEPWSWDWARPLLLPLSWAYGWAQAIHRRRRLGQALRVAVPVVSVGNLSVGGTGKSPLVRALVSRYRRRSPAVLLRGYGARPGPRPFMVEKGTSFHDSGDEALEHAQRTTAKVYIAPDRAASAKKAVMAGASLLVLDDGFSRRWQLGRDLDLLLADFQQLQDGERLLPAGPWREPWAAVAQAGAVLISGAPRALKGAALAKALPQPWSERPVFRLDSRPVGLRSWPDGGPLSLKSLKGKRVLAFSGLGRPERFEKDLAVLGAAVRALRFSDHHVFSAVDMKVLEAQGLPLVCTWKDALRLPQGWKPSLALWVLEAEAQVSPAPAFWRLVDRALRERKP